jgi:hypothetical protein
MAWVDQKEVVAVSKEGARVGAGWVCDGKMGQESLEGVSRYGPEFLSKALAF